MKKMARRLAAVMALCFAFMGAIGASTTFAQEAATVTIKVSLEDNGNARSDISFAVYQVAQGQVDAGEVLVLTDAFAASGANINVSTTEETAKLIDELTAFVEKKQIAAVATGTTDASGHYTAANLPQGMYLIVPGESEVYGTIAASLVIAPVLGEDKTYSYEIDVVPKFTLPENPETPTTPAPTVPPTKPSSPETPILGVEDASSYIGIALLVVGILLLIIAIIALIRGRKN